MSLFRFNSEDNSCQGAKRFASSFCPAKTQSHNAKFNIADIADVVFSASVFVFSVIFAIVIIGGLVTLNIIGIILISAGLVFIIKNNRKQNHSVFSLAA